MQNVPQIVRDRLKATAPAVNHPDADALTAFAEQSLPDGERALVLEHLSRCGDCRDIVALALPEPDAAQAITVPARGGWLTWPSLRWGFAAAGLVVIASFGVLQYQHSRPAMNVAMQSREENVTAKAQPPSADAATTPTRQSEKTLQTPQPFAGTLAASAPVKPSEPKPSEPKPVSHGAATAGHAWPSLGVAGGTIGGPIAYGPHAPTQMQQQTTANQQQAFIFRAPTAKQQSADTSANLRVPSGSQTVSVQGAAAQLETSEANVQNAAPLPSPPAAEQLFDKDAVGKAKPAMNVAGRNVTQLAALTARWAINSSGGLQRSIDQGQTWQDVDVTAGAAPSAGSKSIPAANAARAKEYYADKKTLKAPASPPVFRAVAVTGSDVWAGGSQGALYHSVDSGNQWAQVVPSTASMTLTGDIVGVFFSDAQHGRITTSTSEIWTTSDQGQTWQKQ